MGKNYCFILFQALQRRGEVDCDELRAAIPEAERPRAHYLIQECAIYLLMQMQARRGKEGLAELKVDQLVQVEDEVFQNVRTWKRVCFI